MTSFPGPTTPQTIINEDEITLVLQRGDTIINIAYQKEEKFVVIAAFNELSGDPEPLPARLELTSDERLKLLPILTFELVTQ